MFTRAQIEKFLFFDIETAGGASSFMQLSERMQGLWEPVHPNMPPPPPENLEAYLAGELWTEPVAGAPELDNDMPTVPEE